MNTSREYLSTTLSSRLEEKCQGVARLRFPDSAWRIHLTLPLSVSFIVRSHLCSPLPPTATAQPTLLPYDPATESLPQFY